MTHKESYSRVNVIRVNDEWDFDRNYPLKPDNFSYGARHKAWWLCPKGHSYEAFIFDRVRVKLKCPYCLRKKTLNYYLFDRIIH